VYRREVDNTERGEPAIIIAADTIIVSHKGRILEKPRGEVDHINMLKMLRDEVEHKVMTAVVVMRPLETAVDPGYKMETHVEETTVKFDPNGMDESIK
jgi:septum formation protein